jgi:hypothetical protein
MWLMIIIASLVVGAAVSVGIGVASMHPTTSAPAEPTRK